MGRTAETVRAPCNDLRGHLVALTAAAMSACGLPPSTSAPDAASGVPIDAPSAPPREVGVEAARPRDVARPPLPLTEVAARRRDPPIPQGRRDLLGFTPHRSLTQLQRRVAASEAQRAARERLEREAVDAVEVRARAVEGAVREKGGRTPRAPRARRRGLVS